MADDKKKSGKKYERLSPPKESNPISDIRYEGVKQKNFDQDAPGPRYQDVADGVDTLDYLPAATASRAGVVQSGSHTIFEVGPSGSAEVVNVPEYKTVLLKNKPPSLLTVAGNQAATSLGINKYQTMNALRIVDERKKEKERLDASLESARAAAGRKEYIGQQQNAYRRDIRGMQKMQRLGQQQYTSGLQQLVGNDSGSSAGITQMQPMQGGLTKAQQAQRDRRYREAAQQGRVGQLLHKHPTQYIAQAQSGGAPQQSQPQYNQSPQYNQPQQYAQPRQEENGFFSVNAQSPQGDDPFFNQPRQQPQYPQNPQYQRPPQQQGGMAIQMQDPFTPSFTQPSQPPRFGQPRAPPIDAGSPFGGGDAGSPFMSHNAQPRRVMVPPHLVGKKGRPPPPNGRQPDPVFGI